MRRLSTEIQQNTPSFPHRVESLESLSNEWRPELRFLVPTSNENITQLTKLQAAGLSNVRWISDSADIEEGDVILPSIKSDKHFVLYREGDRHHSLQLTNRCNSRCLMCSQPPTTEDDSWMRDEALAVIQHMRTMPNVLGLTGGEPLILGHGLRTVIDSIRSRSLSTHVEVLTNGRGFSNTALAKNILSSVPENVSWLVPLYGHCDFMHDYVVQAEGAFEETIAGLLALQSYRQSVQLRIVLIEPVLNILGDLCAFIGRNLPFVREVALMACEPIGYALANRTQCELDLSEWHTTLRASTAILNRHHIPFLFMNTPLCALPLDLRGHAHQSISDWKNVYAKECDECALKTRCCGLFAWHEKGWQPTQIKAIKELSI